METIKQNILELGTILTFVASLAMGGCATETADSHEFPQENVAAASDELIVNEYPVVQVTDGEASVVYRAIELPAELSTASREALVDLQVELDIEVPVNELRSAAAGNDLLFVNLDGHFEAQVPELMDCAVWPDDVTELPGFCYGDDTDTTLVVELDREHLISAGFVFEAHTEGAPIDAEKNIEIPELAPAN